MTCELNKDAKIDANCVIINRACGDHPTGVNGSSGSNAITTFRSPETAIDTPLLRRPRG
ncbi:hypothetical protein [Saccharopolyspora mangrovi]|uniref:DUF397 domain-containing protein n=1 Tax=Saccharopolyspora mangrovi TaxID=3082379 RepID=A0ABU6AGB0_9PSEU|nr:hypothetical protein [Saccharopolyspora sp. S2-29]MEB3370471.1 hypothetical protein [Saccharopolyspora sp. S2-29]